MSRYAADGSWNITIVDGSANVGLHAADGSINVVEADGTTYTGAYHPSGAINVFLRNDTDKHYGRFHPCGALNVTDDGTKNGSQKVTIVDGAWASEEE